jgi:tetratricopeptide (TPR) repeat protein
LQRYADFYDTDRRVRPSSGSRAGSGRGPSRKWAPAFAAVATLVLLLTTGAAAGPAEKPVPRNAEADAATYDRCMKLTRQDPAAALKLAQTWHERGGKHPADHCAAVALIGLKQYKEAATRLDALAQAMATAPAGLRAEVLDQAGQAWGLAGDSARAYAAAGAAVALQPKDPELLIDRAEAAASVGYFDKAIADLDIVLKADPNRADALIYRASANRSLDRLDPALADIEQALAQAPNSAPALLERGNIRRLKGDSEGARQDWERVGQLAPGSSLDMAARANLEHLTGNTSQGTRKPDSRE